MGKKAGTREIEDWRQDYWQLVKDGSNKNKEVAAKLKVDPAYLSKIARGARDKNGKPKNPGADFIKHFYMEYTNFKRSPESNEKDANPNSKQSEYDHERKTLDPVEEARLLYMHRTDEFLDRFKTNESFLQSGLTQVLHICTTMSETQKESVINQGLMIKSHDKMVDAHRDMTQSIHLLAETNRDQYLESHEKKTKAKNPPKES
jgi:transcriptional regulator with XRE-family HTH domain